MILSIRHITLVILFSFGIAIQFAEAQVSQSELLELLNEKGISEDSLRARLLTKGYDPNRIRPDQAEEFQKVVLQTVAEMESEKYDQNANDTVETREDTIVKPIDPQSPTRPELPPDGVAASTNPSFIYGQDIFKNNSIQVFQKTEDIIPPENYIIGSGDKIGIVAFGRSQFDQILEVSVDGFIRPSALPKILVRGITYAALKELLYQRFEQYYVITRGEFQVTINRPRNITVNVFGEAVAPGSYTLPAFNTAFNIISAAGGPTVIGSVRNIKVISGNVVRQLDVYEFMNDPSVAQNFFLQNNDYIHIPVAEKVVTINGAITRPFTYELLEKENLASLIKYAGGVKANSFLSDVQITRYLADRRVVTNINYKELLVAGGDYILYNGDQIIIKTLEETPINYVTINGAVKFPGQYERKESMRLTDLLEQSRLKPESRLDYAIVLVHQPDNTYRYQRVSLENILANPASPENMILNDLDQVQIATLSSFSEQKTFSVGGAVRRPDSFSIDPTGEIKLEDAILLAGGLTLEAADFGYIVRRDPTEPKTVEYVHVNLREAFNAPESAENVSIQAGDRILVYNKSNLRDNLTVSIFGAVRRPQEYAYGPNMTLADLVNLAGGFTFSADRERIDIARSEFGNGKDLKVTQYTTQLPADFNLNATDDSSVKLIPYDNIYVRDIPEFELQQTVTLQGEVKYPGVYAILKDNERISDLIDRAGGLTGEAFSDGARMYRNGDATGLVVINLHKILEDNNVPSNVALRSGDLIEIPKSRDLVTIGGNVNLDDEYSDGYLQGEKSISVAFRGEKSAKYYVDNFAAGVSEEGSPSEIKVQFADGHVRKARKFLFLNTYPKVKRGAIITVGNKPAKPLLAKEKTDINWGTVLRDTLTQATAVLTILILVDQLGK
ncbi:MAG: SLBB domain-containing protein [Bacteroidota bacterium]|nr:SLBB domain-containing protein [Bacteroidota bacterium]